MTSLHGQYREALADVEVDGETLGEALADTGLEDTEVLVVLEALEVAEAVCGVGLGDVESD